MGARDLTGTTVAGLGLPDRAATIVAGYLATLQAGLPLPGKDKARIVAEIGDGLACAISAATESGHPAEDAAHTAVAEFGDPARMAAQFTAAIAPALALRTGVALLASGPLVGLTWVLAIGMPAGWLARISSTLELIPLLPLILAVTVPAGIAAIVTGRASLRHNTSSRRATGTALTATLGCICGDIALLAATLAQVSGSGPALSGWVIAAVVASSVRLTAAAMGSRRLTRLRAAGY